MSSVYPGSLDSFTGKTDDVDYNLAAHINDLQDAVMAVQLELGPDPAGGEADVVSRFNALDALIAAIGARFNGWIERSETWTRTGNYTFTVAGDLMAIYRKGTKVRYKDGGSYKYGVVISSSYSAPNTTVTLATNDDYAMGTATITDRAISYIANPESFPHWFNFASTVAYSASGSMTYTNVTTSYAQFRIEGNMCFVLVFATGKTGGTASTSLRAIPPVPSDGKSYPMVCAFRDATTGNMLAGTGAMSFGYLSVSKHNLSNYGLGTGRIMHISGFYTF